MQIVIDIPTNEINNEKTLDEMIIEMVERRLISSSALYLMTDRE